MDPAVVVILAALIGAGSSIAGTTLTMWWTGRHDRDRQAASEAAALRAEKRTAYRDVIVALDTWREACAELADGERTEADWNAYWKARDACLRAGATLQIVGTSDMLDAASEAGDVLADVAWRFRDHPELAYDQQSPANAEVQQTIWVHIGTADREQAKLLDLMRADLGFSPLVRERPTPARPGDTTAGV